MNMVMRVYKESEDFTWIDQILQTQIVWVIQLLK